MEKNMNAPNLNGEALRSVKNARTVGWSNLWCPRCEKHGVHICASHGGGRNELTSYRAECPYCKYSEGFLGSDGTIRTAVAEYKRLCRQALAAKKLTTGESGMQEQQLELNINAFPGVTDWEDAANKLPAQAGWYNVRVKMTDEEREIRKAPLQRRWWDAGAQCFGRPVNVGEEYGNEDLIHAIRTATTHDVRDFEWQGLQGRHPDHDKLYELLGVKVLGKIRV
jgi:hypothetical protein